MPAFGQLYFLDPAAQATDIRIASQPPLGPHHELLADLDRLFREVNPFHHIFYQAREVLDRHRELAQIRLNPQLRLILDSPEDERRYNLPSINEGLAVFVPDIPVEHGAHSYRDIHLYLRHVPRLPAPDPLTSSLIDALPAVEQQYFLTYIQPDHALYLPLQYPLFYPTGGRGFHRGLQLTGLTMDGRSRSRMSLSARMFFRYHLQYRRLPFQSLHYGALLFQQYIIDAWDLTEDLDIHWLRFNQKEFHADLYQNARHAFSARHLPPDQVGRRIVLPSSFTGGDRFMQKLYQDSMAIVRHFGRPALFITFTANPKWEEITQELLTDAAGIPIQTWRDRPNLVVRVFRMKSRALIHEICHDSIFGRCVAYCYTVEYQKWGLPHIHLLVFLDKDAHFDTVERIDQVICAEIPDLTEGPHVERLHNIVTSVLIHRPCGADNPSAPCIKMRNRVLTCGKGFPRPYQDETTIEADGYPEYRCRAHGPQIRVKHPTLMIGDEYVVPYNPYLTLKYNAHINVEVCSSIRAIKYIHKYIFKGGDRSTVEIQLDVDEIKQYINGRYLGAVEVTWRTLEYPVHGMSPSVFQLAIHLPGQHAVTYNSMLPHDELLLVIDSEP
jgi:hypothetical protein